MKNTPTNNDDMAIPAEDVPLHEVSDEVQLLLDRNLRLQAQIENLQKQFQRRIEETHAYANTALAKDLLYVVDCLNFAVMSSNDPLVQNSLNELEKVLKRFNVVKIDTSNLKFDPNLHNAIEVIANPSLPKGSIISVHETGYTMNGRLLRPTMVSVSK